MTETKTAQILDASLAVFCRYGYSKTTMHDIARAAGVSRATLYLYFPNKDELFRAGSARAHAEVLARVEAALDSESGTFDRIDAAMRAYLNGLMEEISASPHGAELFDAGRDLTGQISRETQERLLDRLSSTLDAGARDGELDLSRASVTPAELASVILAAAVGIKETRGASTLSDGMSLVLRVLRAAVS